MNHKCKKCHKVGHFGSQCYSKPAQTASIKEDNEEDLSAELGAFFNNSAQPEKRSSEEFFQCLEEEWLPSYCLEELTSGEAEDLRLTSAASLELELDILLEPELGSCRKSSISEVGGKKGSLCTEPPSLRQVWSLGKHQGGGPSSGDSGGRSRHCCTT